MKQSNRFDKRKSTKVDEVEILLKACGKAQREISLEQNPHGFAKVTKIAKSKKAYSRKNQKNIF